MPKSIQALENQIKSQARRIRNLERAAKPKVKTKSKAKKRARA